MSIDQAAPAVGTDSAEARERWFLGTYLRMVATADDTGGALAVMEQLAPEGFSPPLHVHHREDTALMVLEGRITAQVGDRLQEVEAGGMVWLPRDVPHTFRVDAPDTRLLELITPGGFEAFHVDTSDPAAERAVPPPAEPDIPRLLGALGPYDAEILGPPMGPADD